MHNAGSSPYRATPQVLFLCALPSCRPDGSERLCQRAGFQKRSDLYINSYAKGQDWSDPITQAIEDRFATSGLDVNLHIEYMDSKRYSDEDYQKSAV